MITITNRLLLHLVPRLVIMATLGAELAAQSGWTMRAGVHPSVRNHQGMAFDLTRGVTVLFGGAAGPSPIGDTWEWSGSWTRRTPTNVPAARSGPALTYDFSRARVVLFGGDDGSGERSDTWEYDGITWTERFPAHQPAPRIATRMAYDFTRASLILFGGGLRYGAAFFADTWEWNGTDWTPLAPTTSPAARYSHGMTTDSARREIILFGGNSYIASSLVLFADTWVWNGTDWASLATNPSPPPLTHVALAYDANRERVVLFGGYPQSGLPFGETWLFDGTSWRRDARLGAPMGRYGAAMAHDLLRGRTVLFGGHGNSYLDDTWEYDPGSVARWTSFGNGCAGTAGTPQLRPTAGSLPVLGTVFLCEVVGVPTNGVAVVALGFSDQQWGGLPLPLALATFGMPGCTMYASPDIAVVVPILGGRATLSMSLPNTSSLVGTHFFAQALVVDPGVNALGAVVSNAGSVIVGPF